MIVDVKGFKNVCEYSEEAKRALLRAMRPCVLGGALRAALRHTVHKKCIEYLKSTLYIVDVEST